MDIIERCTHGVDRQMDRCYACENKQLRADLAAMTTRRDDEAAARQSESNRANLNLRVLNEVQGKLSLAVEGLEAVEWVFCGTDQLTMIPIFKCPWCKRDKEWDHAEDCQRQYILSKLSHGGEEPVVEEGGE